LVLVKNYKKKKAQRLQEAQAKDFQHEQEIRSILDKQRETEDKIARQKAELLEQQEQERLDALMKKKNAFPRITYNHYGNRGEFYVDKSTFTIGRDKDSNNFQINIASVSRKHAAIKFMQDGKFIIQDLGSSNGVLINGQKVDFAPIVNGDLIQLGDVKLKFNI
jgi:pSer/pThr/pTyr-binding forkhead associated (FHA) protein